MRALLIVLSLLLCSPAFGMKTIEWPQVKRQQKFTENLNIYLFYYYPNQETTKFRKYLKDVEEKLRKTRPRIKFFMVQITAYQKQQFQGKVKFPMVFGAWMSENIFVIEHLQGPPAIFANFLRNLDDEIEMKLRKKGI